MNALPDGRVTLHPVPATLPTECRRARRARAVAAAPWRPANRHHVSASRPAPVSLFAGNSDRPLGACADILLVTGGAQGGQRLVAARRYCRGEPETQTRDKPIRGKPGADHTNPHARKKTESTSGGAGDIIGGGAVSDARAQGRGARPDFRRRDLSTAAFPPGPPNFRTQIFQGEPLGKS